MQTGYCFDYANDYDANSNNMNNIEEDCYFNTHALVSDASNDFLTNCGIDYLEVNHDDKYNFNVNTTVNNNVLSDSEEYLGNVGSNPFLRDITDSIVFINNINR